MRNWKERKNEREYVNMDPECILTEPCIFVDMVISGESRGASIGRKKVRGREGRKNEREYISRNPKNILMEPSALEICLRGHL